MPSIALTHHESPLSHEWRGSVGMWSLIAAESAMFTIFVVAYLFYVGKSKRSVASPGREDRIPSL